MPTTLSVFFKQVSAPRDGFFNGIRTVMGTSCRQGDPLLPVVLAETLEGSAAPPRLSRGIGWSASHGDIPFDKTTPIAVLEDNNTVQFVQEVKNRQVGPVVHGNGHAVARMQLRCQSAVVVHEHVCFIIH
jgi:hypothetical protein